MDDKEKTRDGIELYLRSLGMDQLGELFIEIENQLVQAKMNTGDEPSSWIDFLEEMRELVKEISAYKQA